jgi:hypothetical protein
MKTTMKVALLGAAFGLLSQAAPIVNIQLTPDTESGIPGSVVSYSGTITNLTGTEQFLNSLSFSGISGDATPFFTFAPLSLIGFADSGTFEMFTVTVPSLPPGIYGGSVSVIGGTDANAANVLGTASFNVQVNDGAVPEPGCAGLLVVGGALLVLAKRRHAGSQV